MEEAVSLSLCMYPNGKEALLKTHALENIFESETPCLSYPILAGLPPQRQSNPHRLTLYGYRFSLFSVCLSWKTIDSLSITAGARLAYLY